MKKANPLVLITGGSGFLGINLTRYLLNKGYRVRNLDIAQFDYPEIDKIDSILGDIRDPKAVKKAYKDVDYIVHCAAALPLYSREDIMSTNAYATKSLLKEALASKIKRFIYISSTAVYGIPDHHPLYETDKLYGVGPYGEAKILSEKYCAEFRKKKMIIPILRPKSFIGPERLGVFSLLYDWAKSGKNFPMIGSGNNPYQLMDVEDLCSVIYACLTKESKKVNDTFNVGAKLFTTMKNDYQKVLDYAGFGKKIIGFPAGPVIFVLKILEFFHLSPLYKWVYETAGKDSFVSIEKVEKKLGYKPKYSNADALIRNYKWYLANLDKFENKSGVSHRVPWNQGILKIIKIFF